MCIRDSVEGVGNHPRAGLQILQQFGAKLQIDVWQQEQGNHRGLANLSVEEVVLFESNQFLDPGLPCVLLRLVDAHGVDVDSDTPSPIALGGGNYNAAIPTTEVVHD